MVSCTFYFSKQFKILRSEKGLFSPEMLENFPNELSDGFREAALLGFCFEGHAEYDEPGYDLVCAAVSTLAATAIGTADLLLATEQNYILSDGYAELSPPENFPAEEFPQRKVEDLNLILESVFLGLRQINESYQGRYIELRSVFWEDVMTDQGGNEYVED